MSAGDLLRLAWEADHDGRTHLRDAVLTLAVTESEPGDHWAEHCRNRLVVERPDHFLCHFPDVRQALEDDRVIEARERLRLKYPEARVQWLLLRARARRGPFLGRVESLDAMIEDLAGVCVQGAECPPRRSSALARPTGPTHGGPADRPVLGLPSDVVQPG